MCVPWCDPDCTKALRLKRAAWNNYRYKRATPSQLSALISIKKTSACLRRTILNSWTIAGEIISPRLYLYLFQLSDVGSRQTSTLSSIFAILSSLIHSYPLFFQPGWVPLKLPENALPSHSPCPLMNPIMLVFLPQYFTLPHAAATPSATRGKLCPVLTKGTRPHRPRARGKPRFRAPSPEAGREEWRLTLLARRTRRDGCRVLLPRFFRQQTLGMKIKCKGIDELLLSSGRGLGIKCQFQFCLFW